ncbi:MAG: hypothetical protein M3Z82_08240 [Apilactobacillus sp.]|uniref:hypothetical protein n=1 Tax=Apilactobacillus nanyangensis TaxID=2799579 RepID=UPI00194557E0|nr:hypothetical protein [Apilactobacillus nanyangensis]MCT6859238.1 hypothetical protein [Apilactobacillus sp.]
MRLIWYEYNPKLGNYKVYDYAPALNGWIFRQTFTPKQNTTTNTSQTTNNTNTTK